MAVEDVSSPLKGCSFSDHAQGRAASESPLALQLIYLVSGADMR